MHEKLRDRVAIEHDGENALHSFHLTLICPFLQLRPQLGHCRDVSRIVLVYQAIGILQEGSHNG